MLGYITVDGELLLDDEPHVVEDVLEGAVDVALLGHLAVEEGDLLGVRAQVDVEEADKRIKLRSPLIKKAHKPVVALKALLAVVHLDENVGGKGVCERADEEEEVDHEQAAGTGNLGHVERVVHKHDGPEEDACEDVAEHDAKLVDVVGDTLIPVFG